MKSREQFYREDYRPSVAQQNRESVQTFGVIFGLFCMVVAFTAFIWVLAQVIF